MRLTSTIPLVLAAIALATPGVAAVRTYPVRDFTKVDAGGVAAVAIHVGPGFAVRADGDDAAVDALTVVVRNGSLVIGMRPGTRLDNARLSVAVTMPRVEAVDASGTGSLAVDRVAGPAFDAHLSGTGGLRLPAVQVGRLKVDISGTGSAHVAGQADRVDLSVSGTGVLDAAGLTARGGRIDASGTGAVRATVDGPVDVQVSGVGSVTVGGHPACSIHRSGVGSVRCA